MTASEPLLPPPRGDGWSSYKALGMVEELAGAGTWTSDLVNGVDRWSWGIYHILGVAPDGLTPSFRTFYSFVHPEDRISEDMWLQRVHDGMTVNRTFRIIRRNGSIRWVQGRIEVVRRDGDRPVVLAGAMVDVTEAHEGRRVRELHDQRREALARGMAAIFWTTCPDGRATGSLPWEALTGQSPAAAADFGWLDMIHGEDRERVRAAWLLAIERRAPMDVTYRLRLADGHYSWQHSRTAPVFDREGALREWTGIGMPVDPGDVRTRRSVEPGVEVVLSRPAPVRLSGAIVRAARALVGWSVDGLAKASGVSVSTLRRIEETEEGGPRRAAALEAIQTALEDAGVTFVRSIDGEAYLRLSKAPPVRSGAGAPGAGREG
jgi:PAS domain S-box-containing protein